MSREKPMKKFSHHPYLLCSSTSLFFFLVLLLFIIFFHIPSSSSSSSPFNRRLLLQQPPFSTHRVLLSMEEKARLGSTPPSCYNKCNGCHPCLAVQVPTLPISLLRRKRQSSRPSSASPTEFLDPSPGRYSNYKPLGWKCRCRNHLFNP